MDEKGLTLIEIIVVMAIIAALLILAWPDIHQNKLDGAARMIYSDLQYARMQAIEKRANVRVLFQTNSGCNTFDGHAYVIHYDANNNGTCDTGETLTNKDISADYSGITFTANNDATFNPEGLASNGTVTLTGSSGTAKNVVFSWTGRIRVQ